MRTLDPTLRGGLLDSPAPSSGRPNPLGGLLGDMNRLQKASLATTLLPVIPDVLGAAGDLQMYAQKPETRTPLNYGLSALGLLPFIGGATAFHGSPYLFDKFSSARIGSGEGAQAFGRGLYFASKQDIADSYRRNVTSERLVDKIYDADVEDIDEILKNPAAEGISQQEANLLAALRNEDYLGFSNPAQAVSTAMSKDLANYGVGPEIIDAINKVGYTYKVDIDDAVIDKMLDYDLPLSADANKFAREALASKIALSPDATGQQVMKQIQGLAKAMGKTPEELLNSMGVPGVKYLDRPSRKAGEGTQNFVLFDEALANIEDVAKGKMK